YVIMDELDNKITDFADVPSGAITIRFYYPADLTRAQENKLRIVKLDEDKGEWVIQEDFYINTSAKWIEAQLSSLSVYSLIELSYLSPDDVYVYPNPWRSGMGYTGVTFTNLPNTLKIKIYTITGELVRTINKDNSNTDAVWDLRNNSRRDVASGVYFYIISKDSGEKKKGKLAIIR
ncbi:MAG: T9SS type A sorting domain-containing protein, partial [Bacteroidetes bacterium]|nr:T9SS type A sorting domain-containing protein [Bacteroidota bacterium]